MENNNAGMTGIVYELEKHSKPFETISCLTDKQWICIDTEKGDKKVYIFKIDSSFLLSINGNVSIGNWELLDFENLLLNHNSNMQLFNVVFYDEDVLVLAKDNSVEYLFLISNTLFKTEVKEISNLWNYLENKYGVIDINKKYIDLQSIEKFQHNRDEDNWIVELFIHHKELFRDLTSSYIQISDELLNRYKHFWCWHQISKNIKINWDVIKIERFRDNLITKPYNKILYLCENNNIQWSVEILDEFEDIIDWKRLSENKGLPWTSHLIEKFINNWDWYRLCKNESISWSYSLIDKFQAHINWTTLSSNPSLSWEEGLIDRYIDFWDWSSEDMWGGFYGLSFNKGIKWTDSLIEKYIEHIEWVASDYYGYYGLSANENIPWSIELIRKYSNEKLKNRYNQNDENSIDYVTDLLYFEDRMNIGWNFDALSYNDSIIWSLDLIETFKEKWNWRILSQNIKLPWSINLLDRFLDKWDWSYISTNSNIPWDKSLIERYIHKWDWEELSYNEGLPWTKELIVDYFNKWNWINLSKNYGIFKTDELLLYFSTKWDWKYISKSSTVAWSVNLLERHYDKWDWDEISENNTIPWTFELIKKFDSILNLNSIAKNDGVQWTKELILHYGIENWTFNYFYMSKHFKNLLIQTLNENMIKNVLEVIQI